jgi:arylsulfatase
MIARGVLPNDTKLTDFNFMPKDQANPGDLVRPWNTLNADEKKLFSRLCEVFAGFRKRGKEKVAGRIEIFDFQDYFRSSRATGLINLCK